jgi:tripartite ATP-independent transporter DctM subunit
LPLIRISDALRRYLDPVSKLLLAIGGAATVAILVITVSNVLLRKLAHSGVPGNIELVELAMLPVVFCSLAYAEIRKGHVRVTFLVDRFPKKAQDVIYFGALIVTLLITAVIAWEIAVETRHLMTEHAITGLLSIPRWPFAAIVSFAFFIFSLAVLINILEQVGKMTAGGSGNYAWLIPGLIVGVFLLITSYWPQALLPAGIGELVFGGWAIILLFGLLLLGAPIGVCMGMATFWGFAYLAGPSAGASAISRVPLTAASTYTWSVLPMFVWMGIIVASIGLATDIYNSFYKLFGGVRGGLASATTCASGAFAAMVGDSLTSVMAMSRIALPSMRERHYDDGLATGSIAAGGTLGILIPPSLGFIIYGLMAEESIGRLFTAGILPGILLIILTVLMTTARCQLNPKLGPSGGPTTFKEKIISLKGLWAPAILFLVIMGGLYTGFFTPTEAGAVGAFVAIMIGLSLRKLSVKHFFDSLGETMFLQAKMFFIFFFALAFTKFLALSEIVYSLGNLVTIFGGGSYWITLALIIVLYFVLGCLMNALPVLIMTLPVVLPLASAVGFNFIWLGVLLVIMAEVGMLTPPVGMTVYGMAGACDVPMATIFKGVVPYWITMLVCIVIIIFFPQISLFLPTLMYH